MAEKGFSAGEVIFIALLVLTTGLVLWFFYQSAGML